MESLKQAILREGYKYKGHWIGYPASFLTDRAMNALVKEGKIKKHSNHQYMVI